MDIEEPDMELTTAFQMFVMESFFPTQNFAGNVLSNEAIQNGMDMRNNLLEPETGGTEPKFLKRFLRTIMSDSEHAGTAYNAQTVCFLQILFSLT
jgi:hypothetical protein